MALPTLLLPCLRVLPMGWSWSMYLAQAVTSNALVCSGFDDETTILDKRASPRLSTASPVCAAGYVDNVGVFGLDAALVDEAAADH